MAATTKTKNGKDSSPLLTPQHLIELGFNYYMPSKEYRKELSDEFDEIFVQFRANGFVFIEAVYDHRFNLRTTAKDVTIDRFKNLLSFLGI